MEVPTTQNLAKNAPIDPIETRAAVRYNLVGLVLVIRDNENHVYLIQRAKQKLGLCYFKYL